MSTAVHAVVEVPTPRTPAPRRDDVERVVAGDGHRFVAQPVVDVAQHRVAGWELLSRFDGPWTPDVWFRAAREHGLDAALTATTLLRARDVARTRPASTFVTVNVEPHLLTDPVVRDVLLGDRLDGWVVELTEHTSDADAEMLEVLDAVRAAGGLVAMDDAGTGWSGLSQMLRIRPDVVKLDRSLVSGLDRDPTRRAAVQLLGDLAGRLDGWVLAEGVETHAELAELVGLEVPLVQGWALGRPDDGWPDAPSTAMAFLDRQRRAAAMTEHVAALVRPATVHLAGVDAATSADPVAAGDVVLDAAGRPGRVAVDDPAGDRHLVPALVVAPSSSPQDVLRRAMARPTAWQHSPVVCTDARGVVLGTIPVAALVERVVGSR